MIYFVKWLFVLLGKSNTKASTPYPPVILVNYSKKEFKALNHVQKLTFERMINHEKIHHAQMRELGLFDYYYTYWKAYFENRKTMCKYDAYINVPFEKEAWGNQNNLTYLAYRQKNAWKSYII